MSDSSIHATLFVVLSKTTLACVVRRTIVEFKLLFYDTRRPATNAFNGVKDCLTLHSARANKNDTRISLTACLQQALDRHLPNLSARVGYEIVLGFRGRVIAEVG